MGVLEQCSLSLSFSLSLSLSHAHIVSFVSLSLCLSLYQSLCLSQSLAQIQCSAAAYLEMPTPVSATLNSTSTSSLTASSPLPSPSHARQWQDTLMLPRSVNLNASAGTKSGQTARLGSAWVSPWLAPAADRARLCECVSPRVFRGTSQSSRSTAAAARTRYQVGDDLRPSAPVGPHERHSRAVAGGQLRGGHTTPHVSRKDMSVERTEAAGLGVPQCLFAWPGT